MYWRVAFSIAVILKGHFMDVEFDGILMGDSLQVTLLRAVDAPLTGHALFAATLQHAFFSFDIEAADAEPRVSTYGW